MISEVGVPSSSIFFSPFSLDHRRRRRRRQDEKQREKHYKSIKA